MNNLIKYFSALDWFLSGVTVALGIYQQNPYVIAGGLLGLALAWYGPAARIKAKLEKKFLRKKEKPSDTGAVLAEDAFYAQVLQTAPVAVKLVDTPSIPLNFSGNLAPGTLYLSANRHNAVQPRHLNLLDPLAKRAWA